MPSNTNICLPSIVEMATRSAEQIGLDYKAYWSGQNRIAGICHYLLEEGYQLNVAEQLDEDQCLGRWEGIVSCFQSYLSNYPIAGSRKKGMWQSLCKWLEQMNTDYFHIENVPSPILPEPFVQDIPVALIKALHDRKGIKKAVLASQLNLKPRQLQSYINSLKPNNIKPQMSPLRFGGETIHAEVISESLPKNGGTTYRTPNSIHPIAFQLNVTQVYVLLESLFKNYEKDRNIPLDIAATTWAQLSDYGHERIRHLCKLRNRPMLDFLKELDDEILSEHPNAYQTEGEMFNAGNMTLSEELDLAVKGGYRVDIQLRDPTGKKVWYENQVIRMGNTSDHHSFITFPYVNSGDPSSGIPFVDSDLVTLHIDCP